MKAVKNFTLLSLLILGSLVILGCSEKKQEPAPPTGVSVEENKPLSEVKAEADKMTVEQLRAAALKYKAIIETKTAEADKLAKDLMKAALADKSETEVKQLNARMAEINKSAEALAERFEVYYKKLEEKGGDMSGLKM